jgi:hypothetical protein
MSNVIFVRDMGRHRIIRTEATPAAQGERRSRFHRDFDAPGLVSSGAATRPLLSYRVKPGEQDPVRVKTSINGTNVVDQTLSNPVSRTFNGAVEHDVIKSIDNELRAFVPADPGSVVVSELILVCSADVEIGLPDPDAPPLRGTASEARPHTAGVPDSSIRSSYPSWSSPWKTRPVRP